MSMSGRREHCTMIVKGDGVEFTIRRYLIRTKNSYYYFQSPALCVFFPYNPYNFCQDYPPAHNDTLKKIHRNTKAGKVLLNTFYSLIDGQMDGRGTLSTRPFCLGQYCISTPIVKSAALVLKQIHSETGIGTTIILLVLPFSQELWHHHISTLTVQVLS